MSTATEPRTVGEDLHAPRHFATVASSDLASALADVNALTSGRTAVPVLQGVHINVTGYSVYLSRTDYAGWSQAAIASEHPTATDEPIVVSARALAGMVRQIGHGHTLTLTLVHAQGRTYLRLAGDGVTYQLLTMKLDDFPALPDDTGDHIATLTPDDIADIARTALAASRDETLPILTGVRLAERQGSLTATSTDRYRATDVNTLHPVPAGFEALVRHKVLEFVARLARRDGDVTVTHAADANDQVVTFTVGGRRIRTMAITGTYPKVDALWPDTTACTATFDRRAMEIAVRRVAEVVERNCPVTFEFQRGAVILAGGMPGDTDATTTVPVEFSGLTGLRTAYNPQFFLDSLATVPGDHIRMAFTLDTRPAVVTGDDSPRVRYLLMPVRLAS